MADSKYVIAPESRSSRLKEAMGIHEQVAASDSIATGLKEVLGVLVSPGEDVVDGFSWVTAAPGANGNITIKTWKNTSGTDPTPAAATAFGQKVSWLAWGR